MEQITREVLTEIDLRSAKLFFSPVDHIYIGNALRQRGQLRNHVEIKASAQFTKTLIDCSIRCRCVQRINAGSIGACKNFSNYLASASDAVVNAKLNCSQSQLHSNALLRASRIFSCSRSERAEKIGNVMALE